MSASWHNVSADRWTPLVKAAGLGSALAAGAYAMAVALQSPHAWLGCAAVAPLLLAIRVCRPLSAFAAGAFWGLCAFALTLGSNSGFAHTPFALALLTLVPACYTGLGSVITGRAGFVPLILGVGWVGVEFALQPLRMRYGLLAGLQGDGVLVHLVSSLTGYVIIAFLIAYFTASIVSVISEVVASGAVSSLRLVPGAVKSVRLYHFETPIHLVAVAQPRRPRAPPIG